MLQLLNAMRAFEIRPTGPALSGFGVGQGLAQGQSPFASKAATMCSTSGCGHLTPEAILARVVLVPLRACSGSPMQDDGQVRDSVDEVVRLRDDIADDFDVLEARDDLFPQQAQLQFR